MIAAAFAAGCRGGSEPAAQADDASAPARTAASRTATAASKPAERTLIEKLLPPAKVTVPEGTTLPLVLETTVSSATSREGDLVTAKLADDVRVGEKVVAPAGSEVKGRVTASVRSGKVKGRARLAFAFDTLVVKGKPIEIATSAVDITAENTKKKDAAIIGGATAGGAILGAIIDGGKGAAIGAGVGAAGGTGTVLATRGKEVEVRAGQSLTVTLTGSAQI
jgi:type IV secretory pathway VirB10-like protein